MFLAKKLGKTCKYRRKCLLLQRMSTEGRFFRDSFVIEHTGGWLHTVRMGPPYYIYKAKGLASGQKKWGSAESLNVNLKSNYEKHNYFAHRHDGRI